MTVVLYKTDKPDVYKATSMFGVEVAVGSLDTIKVKCRQLFVQGLRCGFKIIEGWHFIYEENPSDLLSKEGVSTCTNQEKENHPTTHVPTMETFRYVIEENLSLDSPPMAGKSVLEREQLEYLHNFGEKVTPSG